MGDDFEDTNDSDAPATVTVVVPAKRIARGKKDTTMMIELIAQYKLANPNYVEDPPVALCTYVKDNYKPAERARLCNINTITWISGHGNEPMKPKQNTTTTASSAEDNVYNETCISGFTALKC